MSHPLWAYAFGIFVILHGLGHAGGFWMGNRHPHGHPVVALARAAGHELKGKSG